MAAIVGRHGLLWVEITDNCIRCTGGPLIRAIFSRSDTQSERQHANVLVDRVYALADD